MINFVSNNFSVITALVGIIGSVAVSKQQLNTLSKTIEEIQSTVHGHGKDMGRIELLEYRFSELSRNLESNNQSLKELVAALHMLELGIHQMTDSCRPRS